MAVGDVSISDARYLGVTYDPWHEDNNPYTDMSSALLSCSARIMFEMIDSEYSFGDKGKKSAVSTHYTWMVSARLRIDNTIPDPTPSNNRDDSILGDVAEVIAAGLRNPSGTSAANTLYTGAGTGRFALEIGEYGSTPAIGNPLYTGVATISDISFLLADNETPATERILNIEFKGSGDLARRTAA